MARRDSDAGQARDADLRPADVTAASWARMTEGERIEAIKAAAVPPIEVGAAPIAPARGPMRIVRDFEAVAGGTRRIAGHHLEPADVFDTMTVAARARHDRSGSDAAFVAPFTPGQIAMARHYRDLTERHAAGGMKCSSIEGRSGSSGTGGDFMDAYLAEGNELAALHRKIGTGAAMVIRRIRPSSRGTKATILDRRLVDLVCLGDLTISAVLRQHGWADKGEHRDALRKALAAALDRMQGYGLRRDRKGD